MSVNIRNPLTGQLTNASGGVINPKSINEMIAPIEDGTASKAYAVGEQFIMNDLLCEATQAIAQGDTMVIGTNCEESEQLSKQVKDINTSLTANGNRFEAGYSSANDEYGFNIGSTFYPIGASSGGGDGVVPLLDFDNAIALTANNYTTTKEGCVIVSGYNSSSGIWDIFINDIKYGGTGNNSGIDSFVLQFIPKGTKLRITNTASTLGAYFVPYTYATVDPTVTVYNGVDINFDYANPLHTFTSGNLSYTATEDCWLCGSIGEGNCIVTVNNTQVARGWYGTGYVSNDYIPPLKINKGDVVSVSQVSQYLHIFKGSVVSPEVTVYNEAEVTLDYGNPLFTFDATHLTYTATKTCWLCGNIDTNSGVNHMSINGHQVAFGNNTTQWFSYIPPLKISKGDVVTFTYNPVMMSVYEGTISGSVGHLGGALYPDYSRLIANPTGHSYTATKDCFLCGVGFVNGGDIGIFINGHCAFRQGDNLEILLHAGDVVTAGAPSTSYTFKQDGAYYTNSLGVFEIAD